MSVKPKDLSPGRHIVFWSVFSILLCGAGLVLAADLESLFERETLTTAPTSMMFASGDLLAGFEIDGNIIEGPDDDNDCDAVPPGDVDAAPDWSSIFTSALGCFDEGDPDAGSKGACTTNADCSGKELCVPFVTGVAALPPGGLIATFLRDDSSAGKLNDCTVFGQTEDKNGDPINTWNFKEGGTPPKDDISNVYAYEAADGDDRLLYLALERPTNNGDAHIDFEINQGAIGFNPPLDSSTCPTGLFTGQRCNNDLLVSVDFERGGALGGLRVFRYEGSAGADGIFCNGDDPIPTLNTTPIFDSFAGTGVMVPDPAGTNRICFEDTDDIDNDGDTTEVLICGVNSGRGDEEVDIHPGPGVSVDNHADVIDCLPPNFFTEVAINRTTFGLGGDRCVSSINVKSRASQSITSELKDFAFLLFDTCSNITGVKEEVADDATCDTDAAPLEGWEIRLLDEGGNLVTIDGNGNTLTNPVCTGADGSYSFENLPNGESYTVCELVPNRAVDENFNWLACLPGPADGSAGDSVASNSCDPTNGGVEFCYDAFALDSDAIRDFRNLKQIITCDLTTVKFCDENGDGALDPVEGPLQSFCICVTQFMDDGTTLDLSTTACGTTSSIGEFTETVDTGHKYRVVEDLTGEACQSSDFSATWVETTTSPQDVVVDPGTQTCPAAVVGNTSIPTIDCDSTGVSLNNDTGLCSAQYCFTPVATNACGGVDVSCTAATASGPVVVTEGAGGRWCGDFPAGCPETTTVTCVATTDADQKAECSFDVTVTDNEDPTLIGVPDDVSGQCDDDIPAPANVSCEDNCDGTFAPTFGETDTGTCPRTIVRTWTCTDTCGNSVSDSQTITINDTTPPVLNDVPDDFMGQCDAEILAPAAVTCDDNCDGATIIPVFGEEDSGTCPRTIVRTWTCTDACGNEVSDSQTITIDDTILPVLSGVPDDATGQCDDEILAPADVTCSDNCDGSITPAFEETDTGVGTCPRTIVRTWTCTDTCGNEVSDSQTITIEDTTDPELVGVPADATVECDAIPDPPVVTATDNCDSDVPVDFMEESDGNTCPEIITRTWKATDDCGNMTTRTQTLTVVDTTKPVLVGVPGDFMIECDQPIPGPPNVTATDNCDSDVPVDFMEESDGNVCPEIITRTWTAMDDCGNMVSATQFITVVDTTPPVVSCPADIVTTCNATVPITVTASDNCDLIPSVACTFSDPADPDRFTVDDLGDGMYDLTLTATTVVTVTCDATDVCDNDSDTCSFTVEATCNQACSPGFWRNNLGSWCSETPFNPKQDFCFAGAPTLFSDVFGACPSAPADTAIALNANLTLHESVSSSGGNDQTLFHCTAALLSAHAVSFPVDPAAVINLMEDACDGSLDWNEAFNICATWNKAEDDGGCPLSGN